MSLQITTSDRRIAPSARQHALGFWTVAAAFLIMMGFSAVPTPLYVLYQHRDHFSTVTVTVVFAVYAAGVVGSLLLAGHVSDWAGRKQILLLALMANIISALLFLFVPSLAGLLVARVINGIAVGLTTGTATAYLGELQLRRAAGATPRSQRRAHVVATAVNLGGIGLGPLISGMLAQYAPAPLILPYAAFTVLLIASALLLSLVPETVQRPADRPAWRPERVAVPAGARRLFFAATAAGMAAFAVFGVFTSLVPSFLAGTLRDSSHALAGAVAFAAFAAAALTQIAAGRGETAVTLRIGCALLLPGLAVLNAGMWLPSLAIFLIGGAATGGGSGLVFRGTLAAVGSAAPADAKAEVVSGFFLGAYLGLSVPVVGLGIATQYTAARDAVLAFAAVVAIAVPAAVAAVVRASESATAG